MGGGQPRGDLWQPSVAHWLRDTSEIPRSLSASLSALGMQELHALLGDRLHAPQKQNLWTALSRVASESERVDPAVKGPDLIRLHPVTTSMRYISTHRLSDSHSCSSDTITWKLD